MTIARIDVRDLIGHPGASRSQAVSGTVEGLGTELARVPDDALISGDLLLESLAEGILVSGGLRGSVALRCARCLTAFEGSFDVEVNELFVAHADEEADEYPLEPDGDVDLEQMIRDVVGVELPFAPLCRSDCLGLCEVCGGDKNLGECPGHRSIDPRFAVLSDLIPELPDPD